MTYLFDSVSVTHYILLHNRTLSKHILNQILVIANLLDLTLQYTVKSDIKQVHAFDTEYCYTNIDQAMSQQVADYLGIYTGKYLFDARNSGLRN